MDRFSPEKRSAVMRRIKHKNTKPELMIRRLLWSLGYRYKLHVKSLPGTPDLVFKGRRKVLFVNGCFWHGHGNCPRAKLPATRADFWKTKIEVNKARDERNIVELEKRGWAVMVIWQCEIRDLRSLEMRLRHFLETPQSA